MLAPCLHLPPFRAHLLAWLNGALAGEARACALDVLGEGGAAQFTAAVWALPDAFDARAAPSDTSRALTAVRDLLRSFAAACRTRERGGAAASAAAARS